MIYQEMPEEMKYRHHLLPSLSDHIKAISADQDNRAQRWQKQAEDDLFRRFPRPRRQKLRPYWKTAIPRTSSALQNRWQEGFSIARLIEGLPGPKAVSFLASVSRKRTPTPPPFSAINATPAGFQCCA